jgi:hypothetical protein
MPAMAQDDGAVSIAGTVQLENYWVKQDATKSPTDFSTTDMTWGLDVFGTYLDFNFKKGDIGGRFTLRPFASTNSYAYGTWNFGAGVLTIGNAMNLTFNPAGLQGRGGNTAFAGTMDYNIRSPQLALAFPMGGGTLSIAAAEPAIRDLDTVHIVTGAAVATDNSVLLENILPRFEAKYDVKFGGSHLKVAGSYQTYDEVTATNKSYSIDAWMLGAYYSIGLGPITANANLWVAQNLRNLGGGDVTILPTYDDTTKSITDTDSLGWHLSAGWKISDMLTLQAGYGAIDTERDPITGEVSVSDDNAANYYINMPIFLTKGLTLTPGIGVLDGKNTTDGAGTVTPQGKTTYYGVKWVIRF